MSENIDVEDLARQIALRMDPDALMDSKDVGAYLKCSPRYVNEQYVKAPGFPRAIRLTGHSGRRGDPRWRRQDINAWVNSQAGGQSKQGGRPRKSLDLMH